KGEKIHIGFERSLGHNETSRLHEFHNLQHLRVELCQMLNHIPEVKNVNGQPRECLKLIRGQNPKPCLVFNLHRYLWIEFNTNGSPIQLCNFHQQLSAATSVINEGSGIQRPEQFQDPA